MPVAIADDGQNTLIKFARPLDWTRSPVVTGLAQNGKPSITPNWYWTRPGAPQEGAWLFVQGLWPSLELKDSARARGKDCPHPTADGSEVRMKHRIATLSACSAWGMGTQAHKQDQSGWPGNSTWKDIHRRSTSFSPLSSREGEPSRRPVQIPWASCQAVPGAQYRAQVGCPPVGTYTFWVEAQYQEGLSKPLNLVTCEIRAGQCARGATTPPPVQASPPVPPPPPPLSAQRPPGLVLSSEIPPLVPLGAIPPTLPIPPLPVRGGV